MILDENENILLECEKEDNINKYDKKVYNLVIKDTQVEIELFTKKDNIKKDKKSDKKENEDNEEKNVIIENLKDNEPNDVSENKYTEMKNNKSKSIGVVMYLEKKEYKDAEENLNIHIRDAQAPSFLALIIKKLFEEVYETNIDELIMGHEHGEKNKKCHLQIVIVFEKAFRKLMKPSAVKIKYNKEYTCLIYMQQKTRNVHALKNYCQKERDATIVKQDNFEKYELAEEDENPFIFIKENYNKITIEEARDKLINHDAEKYFKNCNNFETALKKIIADEPKVPFMWMPIPEYLKDFYLPDNSTFYETFNKWYQTYCINGENLDRKKALCLYSAKRSMGKSYFVRHLVSDPEYILEFNNTFCWKKNMNKGIYKLLLLDDMNNITTNNKAMWKSIVASEPTTLRGAWLNEEFKERLPCIITTNDIEMVKIFRDDKLFNTQVFIIEITRYMGAPGTQRDDLMNNDFILTYDTTEKLNKMDSAKNAYVKSNNL